MQFNGPSESERTLTLTSNAFGICGQDTQPWEMRQFTGVANTNNNVEPKFARAVLVCRPNSHPFQDRTVSLEQPVKIGRSVARARPNVTNAIFDCKVLSRNHALLWHENGKFYLQDTKSSNGTFVNNQRLSKSSEESPPREVCSGDIVQFGVDVLEVNKKVTHGCIVATLQLYLPDGKEAKASSSNVTEKTSPTSIAVADFYQLSHYLKEAAQREQMLENKLAAISKLMCSANEAIDENWKSLIEEDRLLTRVDILERQLQATHKTMTDEKLTEEVLQLHQDKERYQDVAKEALRKAMQEKVEALKKMQELEKNVINLEEEKILVQEICDKSTQELQELACKYEITEEKLRELSEEFDKSSEKYKDELDVLNKKVKDSELTLQDKDKLIDELVIKVDSHMAKNVSANSEHENSSINSTVINNEHENTTIICTTNNDNSLSPESSGENDATYSPNSNSLKQGDYNMNVTTNIESSPNSLSKEIENVKGLLKNADIERVETQRRLTKLLSLFEDLKALSKKAQVSEYLNDVISKLDVEIKQIKNFTNQNIDSSIHNNSYKISDEVNFKNEKNENQLSITNELDILPKEGIEKLLEESRQTIKTLQNEVASSKRERELLEGKLCQWAVQLDEQANKIEIYSTKNSELQSKLSLIQEKLEYSEQNAKNQIHSDAKIKEANENIVENLKRQVSALNKITCEKDDRIYTLTTQIVSMKTDPTNFIKSEVSIQTDSESNKILGAENKNNIDSLSISDRLSETEEELAIFKDRYKESAENNICLKRIVSELQKEQETLSSQSRMVIFYAVIFNLIIFLAISLFR